MKAVFLLDNNQYFEVEPSKLLLRQISEGQSAIGVEVSTPGKNPDGTPELDAEGKPVMRAGFFPIVYFPVVLSLPKPVEAVPAAPPPEPEAAVPAKKTKKKKEK